MQDVMLRNLEATYCQGQGKGREVRLAGIKFVRSMRTHSTSSMMGVESNSDLFRR